MNVLVINGNPDKDSFCYSLANIYRLGCEKANHQCKLINLIDLNFDPILKNGYKTKLDLEPDLKHAQESISKAHHIVLVFPIWWGTYPALLKGFIDRVFIPEFAFKYKTLRQVKMLKGKTATVITTMDTPLWYYRFIYKRPAYNAITKSLLNFCGISTIKFISFSPIKKSTSKQREKWKRITFEMALKVK